MDKRWETAAYIDQGALDLVHKLKEGSHHTVCDSSGRNTESTADERDHLACLERQSKTYSRNDGEARPPQFSTVHISLQSSQAGNAWLKVFHSLKKIMVLDVFLNMRLDLRIAFAYILGQRPYSFRNKTACYDSQRDYHHHGKGYPHIKPHEKDCCSYKLYGCSYQSRHSSHHRRSYRPDIFLHPVYDISCMVSSCIGMIQMKIHIEEPYTKAVLHHYFRCILNISPECIEGYTDQDHKGHEKREQLKLRDAAFAL